VTFAGSAGDNRTLTLRDSEKLYCAQEGSEHWDTGNCGTVPMHRYFSVFLSQQIILNMLKY